MFYPPVHVLPHAGAVRRHNMNKHILLRETAAFRQNRMQETETARINICLELAGAPRLEALGGSGPVKLAQAARRLRLGIAKERRRGLLRHHRYDLNRHIAMKRALDAVTGIAQTKNGAEAPF
jgi:hypothetical protein